MIGTTIAHYKVTEKIGAGGMGEVWRATDTKLNRDVALKILPEVFTRDAERMARFSREAQVLASLNHANIAAIYGTEEFEQRRALVLELVEGEDLRERLEKAALPQEEALEIARQMAEALEAAHDKGVIHRDLKPGNVKLTADGGVKVLDFGLAKALEGDPSAASDPSQSLSPTLTQAATRAGVILGTAAYMSPEQAKGKPADRRADIFSFGAVLYEMLTGRQAFSGETVSDTLASVLKEEPDWGRLPDETSEAVAQLLRRCLEKNPKERLQSIGEARIALRNVMMGTVAGGSAVAMEAAATERAMPARRAAPGPALIAAILVTAAVAGAAGWWLHPEPPEIPPRRYTIAPENLEVAFERQPAISPDGRRVAYLAGGSLWVRALDELEAQPVQGSQGAGAVSWSPDGSALIFVAAGKLHRVAATGGPPAVLAELGLGQVDASCWSPDGYIYLAPDTGEMHRVPAQGGDPRPFLSDSPGDVADYHTPSPLPGGTGLLYTVHRSSGPDTIEAWRDGRRKIVLRIEGERIESAQVAPGGYLVYFRQAANAGVWAVPFSAKTLETAGEPFLLDAEGAYPSVAADGTLLYAMGVGSGLRQLVWVSREGEIEGTVGQPMEGIIFPEISPGGGRVLVSAQPGGARDIWIVDAARGTWTRATFSEGDEWSGGWLPGGDRIFFSVGSETFSRAADGTDEPQAMGPFVLASFREGSGLGPAQATRGAPGAGPQADTGADLVTVSLEAPGVEPEPLLAAPKSQSGPSLSPDGTLVAYHSEESGRREVYLKRFPSGEGKWQASRDGGWWPRWSRDGRELYYHRSGSTSALMVVEVTREPRLRLSMPVKLFDEGDGLLMGSGPRRYDVHPGGERFLMVRAVGLDRDLETRLAVTQNWLKAFGR